MKRQPETLGFDDLLVRVRELPEGHRGQIFEGEIHVTPPPTSARAHAMAEISAMLVAGSALGDPSPQGWSFLSNVEVARGEALLVADVAGWRMEKVALAKLATPIRTAPAWVCDVLCANEARRFTLTSKRRAWAEIGVGHLWIADPESQVVEIFQNQRGKWLLLDCVSRETPAALPPFESMGFDVGDLWIRAEKAPSSRRPR